ncbi:WD40-repeat-containing domain protein, partial [Mrakia frigida]|uniref:COMPASS subunit protein SWD1 n=1 Tax=Mrakia frigida TaxID=29902 RepID=UPI003FCC0632
ELLNPFGDAVPDEISYTLDDSAHCSRFNPSGFYAGSFLAVGRADGFVSVWDVETKGVAWVGQGHSKQVESVCWSRNSRFLLSSSKDSTCVIWDLETGDRKETLRFEAPVLEACFHPHNSQIVLATLSTNQAFLIDLRPSSTARHEIFDVFTPEEQQVVRKKSAFVTARFSPDGRKMFLGTKGGELLVFDSGTREVVDRIKISNSAVRTMEFDRFGRNIVINSSDRAVRVLAIAPHPDDPEGDIEVTPLHRFQDLINRTPWNGVGFSGDGEYVIGGAGHKASHDVYIWDRGEGTLQKILEGPKEPLEDVTWHPTRPMIASVSSLGSVHIWSTATADTWSAFAPGFEELEENHIYEEKEDEFDIEDASSLLRRKRLEEDYPVDILS